MKPEQLRLIQKLAEVSEDAMVNNAPASLIDAISEMNCKAIELILEDKITYQDTTKTIFLQKLQEVFKEFQKKDNKLIAYEGKYNSDECININKKGIAFVGNKSGRYITFIIEENEDGSLKDIYNCSDFYTDKRVIDENKRQLSFTIYDDEKVTFVPSASYDDLKNKSITALNEIQLFNDCEISKDEIFTWIKRYEELYISMNRINNFYKYHYSFYWLYEHINQIYKFLMIENEAKIAIDEFKSISLIDEIDLLKWLVKQEHLYNLLILLFGNVVSEESLKTGKCVLHQDYTVYFKIDILKNCINLQELLEKYYYEKLNKYNTLSPEEQENQIPFDDGYEETSSLKYHLQLRGII
ncbi:hypothetical protein FVB9288_02300 [Flavobacterium sp. CECT 9288]|uniref:hypothetical protein n=1 Tax=Flavobacterium sp. CECT 9288 TaxID=2845819 RepID=UPI001E610AA9|nr:hypothetical protein [Flavobacterium sp. CECT 9288]CAH0336592.1 hypothetical protein FVB9288_02300 [Flavobacterium sp. CECT 9288]